MNKLLLLSSLFLTLSACSYTDSSTIEEEKQTIDYEDIVSYTTITGRYYKDDEDKCLEFYNSGSKIELKFTGTFCSVVLNTQCLNSQYTKNQISILLDDEIDTESRVKTLVSTLSSRSTEILVDQLENVEHTLTFIKRQDSAKNCIKIFSFVTDGYFKKYEHKYDLKLELYGDSISQGAGSLRTLDASGDAVGGYTGLTSSFTACYAWYAAQSLNAQISNYGRGSIALHYQSPNQDYTIDQNYNSVAVDIVNKEYDFSYKPNIEIIYLGTNDYNAGLLYDLNYSDNGYKQATIDFINNAVWNHYGDIPVVLCSGYMVPNSNMSQNMKDVAKTLTDSGHAVYSIEFASTSYGHPIDSEHRVGGAALARLINQIINTDN